MRKHLSLQTVYKKSITTTSSITKKNIRFDFDGEIKIRYVRYKHLTEITIKVQLF